MLARLAVAALAVLVLLKLPDYTLRCKSAASEWYRLRFPDQESYAEAFRRVAAAGLSARLCAHGGSVCFLEVRGSTEETS